jgi:hypothetical protein
MSDNSSPIEIPATQEEEALLHIAVRLACAATYWEKNAKTIKAERRENWFHDGISDEMVCILLFIPSY